MKKTIIMIISMIFAIMLMAGAGGNVEDAGLYKIRSGDWFVMQQGSDSTLYRGDYDSLLVFLDSLRQNAITDSLGQELVVIPNQLNIQDTLHIGGAAKIYQPPLVRSPLSLNAPSASGVVDVTDGKLDIGATQLIDSANKLTI